MILEDEEGFRRLPNSNGNSMAENDSNRSGVGRAFNRSDNVQTMPLPNQNSDDLANDLKVIEQLKERFAKLLLGEDMSGGGKGVSSALALSNAITNTAASVFGEQRKLEPMQPEQKARWTREIDSLLSVTDYIVEFSPSQQIGKDGTVMEIMTTKQRTDLQMNIPALKKLDVMLIGCLDNFKDQKEFYYVKKNADDSEKKSEEDGKWWLPTVKVPPNGLSEDMKKWMQSQKDSVNQVLKAAMAINAQVLSEMEVPENYIDSLPKNGRSSLGESMYKSITIEYFDPEQFLSAMDLSSEHKIVDLKDRIEASIVIWKRKMNCNKDTKAPWGAGVKLEKREVFEDRAETILLILKHRFPGISQSSLDISKIQFNRDVGHAILESYSRILESLAHKVLSQIEDVIHADTLAQNPTLDLGAFNMSKESVKSVDEEAAVAGNGSEAPCSRTLLDFMTWPTDDGDDESTPTNSDDVVQDAAVTKTADEKSKSKSRLDIPRKYANYMRF